jgi:hypothetical protein
MGIYLAYIFAVMAAIKAYTVFYKEIAGDIKRLSIHPAFS